MCSLNECFVGVTEVKWTKNRFHSFNKIKKIAEDGMEPFDFLALLSTLSICCLFEFLCWEKKKKKKNEPSLTKIWIKLNFL